MKNYQANEIFIFMPIDKGFQDEFEESVSIKSSKFTAEAAWKNIDDSILKAESLTLFT